MTSRFKLIGVLLAFTTFSLVSCSDSSTSADQPEPPAVPEALPVEINSSIFDNDRPSGEEYDPFNQAWSETIRAEILISSGRILQGRSYLEFLRSNESEFEDGVWTWTFSSSQNGYDVSVRTTAEELPTGYQWNIYLGGQVNGENVSEFLFLSGMISNDESNGTWLYYTPDNSEQTILEYYWEVRDETHYSFSRIFRTGTSPENRQLLHYAREGADNTLEYIGFFPFGDLEIYWNSETGTGYYDQEGEDRRCWNESYEEIACS